MTKQNNYAGFICDGVQCRSVSSILRADDKRHIANKSGALRNARGLSARAQFATELGLAVHSAVRSVLKGGAPELPDKFYPYFSHI